MKRNELEKLTKEELIEKFTDKEVEKQTIKIKKLESNEVIYESGTAQTIKEAVEEAVKMGVDLSEANLSWANLSEANLSEVDLSGANLSEADLSEANLSEANLSGINYWKTNFWNVKLTKKTKKQLEKSMSWEVVDELN